MWMRLCCTDVGPRRSAGGWRCACSSSDRWVASQITAKVPPVCVARRRQMYVSACSASTEHRIQRSRTSPMVARTSPGSHELRLDTRRSTSRVAYAGSGRRMVLARSRAFCSENCPAHRGCSAKARRSFTCDSGLLAMGDQSCAPAMTSRSSPPELSSTRPARTIARREMGFCSKKLDTQVMRALATATAREGFRSPSRSPALTDTSQMTTT
mmetsp:Transcript_22316/g.75121  ORF Transcript_22316/g.75121 Transcript_22316/m.75121 type:complete len:212 (+) Transcript_22316:617-1252(+)